MNEKFLSNTVSPTKRTNTSNIKYRKTINMLCPIDDPQDKLSVFIKLN